MADLFSQILNMSLTGSIVILVVLAVRACMRKLPKIFSYALWSVVLFRLLCPASLSAPGSLLGFLKPQVQETTDSMSVVSYLPVPEASAEFQYVPSEMPGQESSETDKNPEMTLASVCTGIWAVVSVMMVLYGVAQYVKLRRKLIGAVLFRHNIYLADHIDTAFVMGILAPRIYLPSHVADRERKFILAHERCHIRRGDHVIKLLAYLALCIHWFNPLVWLAFILAGKDMEMSCDEAVIRRFGSGIRAEYSASLLRLAAHRKAVPGMPLAFGEGDTKGRIMNMAKWKKPKLWVSMVCIVLCVAVLVACAVNPTEESTSAITNESGDELAPFSQEYTNILITCFTNAEANGVPAGTFLLSVHPQQKNAAIATVLGDTYVSIPNYQGHQTGNNRFGICYALGKAWGGVEGAEEMVNQCMLDNFSVTIDHNIEFIGDEAALENILEVIFEDRDVALSPDMKAVCDDILSMISGSDDLENTKAALAAVRLESCTIPSEGTYMAKDVNIGGSMVPVLVIGDPETNQEKTPLVDGVDIVLSGELIQYGSLKMYLPENYSSYAQNGGVILTKDGLDVGGIRCYNAPDVPFTYSIEYLRAMGLPEAQETDEPIAYMIGNDIAGGIEAEFFHELKPETLNVEHHIYLVGNLVYDLYYDQNLISDVKADKFLKTVELAGEVLYPAQPETEESLILCKNLVDLVRAGAYQVSVERKNQGEYALNGSSSTVYTALKEDWVSITHVPDDGSYHGYMNVNGNAYSNEGTAWEEDGSVNWKPDPYPDEVYAPWIASFQWDGELISYTDTIYGDGKKVVMLRIDEPFPGYEDLTECYFVNVHFTEDGSFLYAKIEIDFIWENEVSSVNITESIITLDEPTVKTYLENEYTRASSEN